MKDDANQFGGSAVAYYVLAGVLGLLILLKTTKTRVCRIFRSIFSLKRPMKAGQIT